MNRRQRAILEAFRDLGGEATIGEVALKTGFNTNGISQSLGYWTENMLGRGKGKVGFVSGRGREARWKLINTRTDPAEPDPQLGLFAEGK